MKHCSPKHKVSVRADIGPTMEHCTPKYWISVRADIGPTMAGRMEHCTPKHRVIVRTDIGPTMTVRWAKTPQEGEQAGGATARSTIK